MNVHADLDNSDKYTVFDLISAHFPVSAQYANVWGIGL